MPFSLAAIKGIINLFSFPAGTKMFQFPAYIIFSDLLRYRIRKSQDQILRADPLGLSQLATSFITT